MYSINTLIYESNKTQNNCPVNWDKWTQSCKY